MYVLDGPGCDCSTYRCESVYDRYDSNYEPSRVRCARIMFLECFYFIMVTISTLGYGIKSKIKHKNKSNYMLSISYKLF